MEQPMLAAPGSQPKHKNAVPIIVVMGVVILGLLGALLWVWFTKDHTDTGAAGSGSKVATGGTGGGTASGPCDGGTSNTLPTGFSWYENATLRFKFAYPSSWGSVSVTTTPTGGVGGHYLTGHFSANADVTFGGNATDYIVQGRDGIPTDNPGFLQAAGKFYTVQIWTFRPASGPDEPKSTLYPITEAVTLKNGCNTKAAVSQYAANELIDYSYDVARINLQPTNDYYGVNFVLKNPDAGKRTQLDTLITSFQLIP